MSVFFLPRTMSTRDVMMAPYQPWVASVVDLSPPRVSGAPGNNTKRRHDDRRARMSAAARARAPHTSVVPLLTVPDPQFASEVSGPPTLSWSSGGAAIAESRAVVVVSPSSSPSSAVNAIRQRRRHEALPAHYSDNDDDDHRYGRRQQEQQQPRIARTVRELRSATFGVAASSHLAVCRCCAETRTAQGEAQRSRLLSRFASARQGLAMDEAVSYYGMRVAFTDQLRQLQSSRMMVVLPAAALGAARWRGRRGGAVTSTAYNVEGVYDDDDDLDDNNDDDDDYSTIDAAAAHESLFAAERGARSEIGMDADVSFDVTIARTKVILKLQMQRAWNQDRLARQGERDAAAAMARDRAATAAAAARFARAADAFFASESHARERVAAMEQSVLAALAAAHGATWAELSEAQALARRFVALVNANLRRIGEDIACAVREEAQVRDRVIARNEEAAFESFARAAAASGGAAAGRGGAAPA